METQTHGVPVESSGGFKQGAFTVELSQHTFNVLSSGLYSDKHLAIVRELACNAWDAHIAAGNTATPFEVYLPNNLEPTFRIRDFGTGMSEDDVMSLYTTYFASTKQRSNDTTGCFGLGSKSPFAYTKSFTVVSIHNGKKMSFSCFIADKGFPQIIKLAEEPTTDHNGIDISFVVGYQDHYRFVEAANTALRWFKLPPTVKGSSSYHRITTDTVLLSGKDWKILPGSGNNLAIMGNVAYPLRKEAGFSETACRLLSMHIQIEFPIGAFEVTPSREGISYTEYSRKNIVQRLEDILEEVTTGVTATLAKAKTLYEARQVVFDYLDNSAFRFLGIVPEWNGLRVRSQYDFRDIVNLKVRTLKADSPKKSATTLNSADVSWGGLVQPNANNKFYYADFPSAERRVANDVRDNFKRGQTAYLLVWNPPSNTLVNKAARDEDEEGEDNGEELIELTEDASVQFDDAIKQFADGLGISVKDIIPASSVPKRVRVHKPGVNTNVRRSRLAGTKARAFTLNERYSGNSDENWTECEVDMSEGGIYVELLRYDLVNPKRKSKDLGELVRGYKAVFGKDIGTITGVKAANIKKFTDNDDWYTLSEFITHEVKTMWDSDADLRYCYCLYHHKKEYGYYSKKESIEYDDKLFDNIILMKHNLPEGADVPWFSKLSGAIERFHAKKSIVRQFEYSLASYFHADTVCTYPKELNMISFGGMIDKRYPLLHHVINSYSFSDSVGACVDYVLMVENKLKGNES